MLNVCFVSAQNSIYILSIFSAFFSTKWKRQSAVGLELLNEATNCAAVQQLLQVNGNYWSSYLNAINTTLMPPNMLDSNLMTSSNNMIMMSSAKSFDPKINSTCFETPKQDCGLKNGNFPSPATLAPPATFRYFPPTDENHYPSVMVPGGTVKSILTIDNAVTSRGHFWCCNLLCFL